MLYTLEGYNDLGFSVKKAVKKVTKKATNVVKKTAPIVAQKAIEIAKKPEVLQMAAVAAGTAVGIPPQVTAQAISTVQQAKTTYEEIKNNPVAKQAILEVIEQKEGKIIKPEELDLLFEKYEEAKKAIVKKTLEHESVAKLYWQKGELV